MKERDLKEYIGKVVTVHYRRPDGDIDSVQGEVLTIDQGIICLGVNAAGQLSGEVVRIVSIEEVISVEDYVESIHSSDRFLTVGNFYRYCSHLLTGTHLKSIGPTTDFYAASDQYLLAMKSGFITDEIVILYLETVTGYLSSIRMDRNTHDEDLYKKELEDRIECFLKFRAFLNSDNISFKNLSDHAINKILVKLYIYKSCAYAEKIFRTVYERYPKKYLVDDLDKLLDLPKIAGSILLFAMQTEAMFYLAKAQACSVIEDREALYGRKMELDSLANQCKILCQKRMLEYQAQYDDEADFNLDILIKCEQLSDMIKNVDDYKIRVSQEEDKVSKDDLKPLMFSLAFDRINKELSKIEETLSSNGKTPERLNLQSIKSRYDISMAQFFNLFEYIALYEKDPEDEAESNWQIALQIIDIYSRKLRLIPLYRTQEYLYTKTKYRKAIKDSLLSKLGKATNGNYFYECKRSKLIPLSDLLYEFEFWQDFILISDVLLDDSLLGPENKTPDEYRMLCYFRLASIYSSDEGSFSSKEKFKRNFDNAVNIYNRLRHNNNRNDRATRLLEPCDVFYANLYPAYRPELGAIINLKNKLDELRKKVEANCLNTSKLKFFREDFVKLLDEGMKVLKSDCLYEYEDENDSAMFSLIDELLAYLDDGEFTLARRLNEQISDHRFRFDISHLFLRQQNVISNINNRISDVKYGLLRSWPKVIKEFEKNHKGENKLNAIRITNDFLARFDMMMPLAAESIVSIVLEVFGKEKQKTVNNFIRCNISLLIEKALLLGIEHNVDFHKMLLFRCVDFESKKKINMANARCLDFLARYPADESIDERIQFCKKGMEYCNQYFKKDQISKDWANLDSLHKKLLMKKEIKTLEGLQRVHTPQSTVDFLYEQFTNADKLKYLTHAGNGTSNPRRYTEQLQGMSTSFEEEIKKCKSTGAYIPAPVEEGIRSFINGTLLLDGYMYQDYDERQPVGWGTPLWREWLNNHSSVSNPLNDGIDFPYLGDVARFRSMFRIESNQQISGVIAAVAPDVTQIIGRGSRKYHYYGWLPQVAAAVKQIVADIRQIKEDAEIVAEIDLRNGTLTIIHKDSVPTESAESFYAKLSEGGGAIFEIAKACFGVCDYHVVANWSDGLHLQKVNILNNAQPAIEEINEELNPGGFRHVLTFYKHSK